MSERTITVKAKDEHGLYPLEITEPVGTEGTHGYLRFNLAPDELRDLERQAHERLAEED